MLNCKIIIILRLMKYSIIYNYTRYFIWQPHKKSASHGVMQLNSDSNVNQNLQKLFWKHRFQNLGPGGFVQLILREGRGYRILKSLLNNHDLCDQNNHNLLKIGVLERTQVQIMISTTRSCVILYRWFKISVP